MGGKNPCEGPSLLASVPYLRNLPRLRKGRGDISWKGVFVVWTAVWGASFENDGGGGRRSSRRVCDKDDSTNGRTLLPSLFCERSWRTRLLERSLIAFAGPKWCNYRALASVQNNRRIVLHSRWNGIVEARSWDELRFEKLSSLYFFSKRKIGNSIRRSI